MFVKALKDFCYEKKAICLNILRSGVRTRFWPKKNDFNINIKISSFGISMKVTL